MKTAHIKFLIIFSLIFGCSDEQAETFDAISVSFSSSSYSASEDTMNSEVTVSIEVIGTVTAEDNVISLSYNGGTADTSDVSTALPILITIPSGDYSIMNTFDVVLTIEDDDIDEDDESLMISINSESENVVITSPAETNISITDNESTFELQGHVYTLINYIVETPMDLNNDGVFSTDLLEESIICVMDIIEFREDNTIFDPTYRSTGLEVGSGNMQQQICVDPDGAPFAYELIDDTINLSYQEYLYSGILSNDNSIIEFDIPFERILGFNSFFGGNEYVSENDGVQLYTGGVIAVYEIVE